MASQMFYGYQCLHLHEHLYLFLILNKLIDCTAIYSHHQAVGCTVKNDASMVCCGIDFIPGNSACTFVTVTLDSSNAMEQILQKSHDAIREVRKYANEVAIEASIRHTADSENVVHMRLFRAQRNLYISGFSLLLFLVIKRLVALLSRGAMLEAAAEAAMKQAENASKTAKSYMYGDNEREKELERQVEELGKGTAYLFLAFLHADGRIASNLSDSVLLICPESFICVVFEFEELKSAQLDKDAMKEQAEGLQREYDRVCGLLEQAEKASGDKKED
ncbi:hypothetical protein DINM_020906 [Dirofilaria immitis]|nr:hypothetical protein [Dirofilaria immitis]